MIEETYPAANIYQIAIDAEANALGAEEHPISGHLSRHDLNSPLPLDPGGLEFEPGAAGTPTGALENNDLSNRVEHTIDGNGRTLLAWR